MTPFALLAATTADDVFKSMNAQSQGGGGVQAGSVLLVVAAAVGLVVLISAVNRRDRRPKKADAANQPARLLKQIAKDMGLRRKDVRELKKLAAVAGVEHPLTLLLCPSVMRAAMAKREVAKPTAR